MNEMDIPPPLKLTPSLSHADTAFASAMRYEHECKEGDTILMNYYEWPGILAFTYLKKENNEMKEYQWHGTREEYKEQFSGWKWTFNTSGME